MLAVLLSLCVTVVPAAADVKVDILEGVPDTRAWELTNARLTDTYAEPAFAFVAVPTKYSAKGHALERSSPFALRATARIKLPAGKYQVLVRARNAARLFLDDTLILEHALPNVQQNGHNPVTPPAKKTHGVLLEPGQVDKLLPLQLDGKEHEFRFEVLVGSRKTRLELGSPVVAIAALQDGDGVRADSMTFQLLGGEPCVMPSARRERHANATARQCRGTRLLGPAS
jgi:hypothetical protein